MAQHKNKSKIRNFIMTARSEHFLFFMSESICEIDCLATLSCICSFWPRFNQATRDVIALAETQPKRTGRQQILIRCRFATVVANY